MKKFIPIFTAALFLICLPALAEEYGYNPDLAEPNKSPLPTVNIAGAAAWPEGKTPEAAQGFQVRLFADGFQHPRWLYVLPNGDVLVAETNAPPKPKDMQGIKGWFMKQAMKKAGAGPQSADRITLLRDADGNGQPETRAIFLSGLYSPFGMALRDQDFYVANTDAVVRFTYKTNQTQITAPGEKVADLPAGPINHHWTKNIVIDPGGRYLYASIGSNSNAAENGLDAEKGRAAIQQIDLRTGQAHVYAFGLRNPVGMDWNPVTGELWTSVNERDELGDELVPDYMTSVKEGGFYGWPFSYYGQHIDTRVKDQNSNLVAQALVPDYALGAHTASLGLAFYKADLFPPHYKNGAFVGQHGSWNRKNPAGYKVIFVPFANGKPSGPPEDILTGFREGGKAYGRPVGVAVDKQGALLVADDVGNVVWRITPSEGMVSHE